MDLLTDLKNPLWEYENVVYCYTNKINGKKYVGQVTRKLRKRHMEHLRNNLVVDIPIRKYGVDNFSLNIIHIAETLDELNYFEKFYIKLFNCFANNGNGYNVSSGGGNGNNFIGKTEDEMKLIRRKMSENHCDCFGENNNFYGKTHSDETKKKIGNANRNRKNNGVSESNRTRFYKQETKDKIAQKHMLKIIQMDMDGNFIKEWNFIKEASCVLGVDNSCITKCCKGKRKSCGGFTWKYSTDIKGS